MAMYDVKRRVDASGMTVEQLITALSKMPKNAQVLCCGDSEVYIHVEKDSSAICIDMDDLQCCYD